MVAEKVVEAEGVDALLGRGEIRVDLEAVEVADDQQRRVAELLAVVVELAVAFLRSLCLPLYSQAKWSRSQTSAKPLPPRVFGIAFSKAYRSPAESAAAGCGSPSMSHTSMKWD